MGLGDAKVDQLTYDLPIIRGIRKQLTINIIDSHDKVESKTNSSDPGVIRKLKSWAAGGEYGEASSNYMWWEIGHVEQQGHSINNHDALDWVQVKSIGWNVG